MKDFSSDFAKFVKKYFKVKKHKKKAPTLISALED